MKFDVLLTNSSHSIDFAPESTLAEIIQNVRTICSTVKGSVPLDRQFGIDGAILDEPVNISQAKISSQIILAIRKFEPRVKVSSIDFTYSPEGKLTVKLELDVI